MDTSREIKHSVVSIPITAAVYESITDAVDHIVDWAVCSRGELEVAGVVRQSVYLIIYTAVLGDTDER